MIKGIGIDATELERVAKIIERRPHFVDRILTPAEQTLFASHSPHRQVEFLAGRYACKEAFSKAWGTGIGKVSFQELEILRDDHGAPAFTKSQGKRVCQFDTHRGASNCTSSARGIERRTRTLWL